MIRINGNTIHLQAGDMSYVMFITDEKYLMHFHFGKKIKDRDYSLMEEYIWEDFGFTTDVTALDVHPQEYPAYGRSDLRDPAYEIKNVFGNTLSELTFKEYNIIKGTLPIKGMPSLFSDGDGETLEVVMEDKATGLLVKLYYTVFDKYSIIARNAVLCNNSDNEMVIESAFSASVDLPVNDYEIIYFSGAWARERYMQRTPLKQGLMANIGNMRGASGHQLNPFVMVATEGATETEGDVYGFSLIYSGNHSTVAKVDHFGCTRIRQGINPSGFEWTLKKGESFATPQSVICYSADGFGTMSHNYHRLYKKHLMRSKWKDRRRPLLVNNWEGTYFDFNEEKILEIAKVGMEVGLDLFVLDDGWFGNRNDDKTSLGDWFVNRDKLPSGIDGLAKKINDLGLMFGLWFEPEMISRESELYKKHPDWAIQVEERRAVEVRNQLILDITRDEVKEYVIETVSGILSSANIGYVKWDMNRQMTDMPCKGYNHRYTLALYEIMEEITSRHPDVLFEGCSAGGGRFDAGILAYMPQIWASDNSDAVARLSIQHSTSMCYPVYSISTHVTASPNGQNGRITSLKTRGDTAYMGTFGYELDLTKATDAEKEEIKKQVEFQHKIADLVRCGDFYRLMSPYEGNFCGWEMVSEDKSEALLYVCKVLVLAQCKDKRIKLLGLDPDARYVDSRTGKIYDGDFLINFGIRVNYKDCDFATEIVHLTKVE